MPCPFIHDNIAVLHGVAPMPLEQLPKVCCCGAPLTYAPEVVFVSEPMTRTKARNILKNMARLPQPFVIGEEEAHAIRFILDREEELTTISEPFR